MDEQKVMAEFGKVYSELTDIGNATVLTAKMTKSTASSFNELVDIFNSNAEAANRMAESLLKCTKRQNIVIVAGIAGFVYLFYRVKKLEEKSRKE